MTHDPATIAALIDGELDDITARRIEREAEADPALAAEIARHRRLRQQLSAHYAPVLDEAVPDRLTAMLRRTDTGDNGDTGGTDNAIDTSLTARREAKQTRFGQGRFGEGRFGEGRFGAMQWGAIAAALVLGLTVGTRPWVPAGPVAVEGGTLVAAGPLAKALDTQLASTQSGDAPVRIGLSFKDKAGRYCRSFDSAAVAGIGCRDADAWRLEQTMRGSTGSEYRQANSGMVAAAAAEMMAGAPFDAAAEAEAKDKGWT